MPTVGKAGQGTHPVLACLFDMDGVIRHWKTDVGDRAEDAAGLPRGVLTTAAFGVPEYHQGTLGRVSFDDWCAATETALAKDYGIEAAHTVVQLWYAYRGDVDRRVVMLIATVREQVPVGLLSNAHDCLNRDLEFHGLTELFDAVICSATVHLAKPDSAIYAYAAHALGVEPNACFFSDDLEVNVAAARNVGMQAHRFTDIKGLTLALSSVGIDLPTYREAPPGSSPAFDLKYSAKTETQR